MDRDTGPSAGAKGIVEDMKGKAKEVVGEVTGNESLEDEGRAQQDKAHAQREVAEHEAKADAARTEASVHEAEQRSHQTDETRALPMHNDRPWLRPGPRRAASVETPQASV